MQSTWDTLWANHEWLFSGLGVFVLSGVVWTVRHFWIKRGDATALNPTTTVSTAIGSPIATGHNITQQTTYNVHLDGKASTATPALDYRRTPTPPEILDRIKNLPLFEQRSASNTYTGVPVEWPVRLIELSGVGANSEYDLRATYDNRGGRTQPGVTCSRIDLTKNPRLKTAYHNERLTVRGVIERLDLSGEIVHLRDVDVVFPMETEANENVLHEVRFDYLPGSPLQNGWIKVSHHDEHPRFDTFPSLPGSLRMRADGKVFAMDYVVPTVAESSSHVKFIGEFGQGAIFYANVTVVSKFGGIEEDWWFAHVAGDQKRSPEKESGREWKFYVSPIRTKENHFDIDLSEEAERVMDNGKRFTRIKKLRLRGDIILSPINLVKG